MSNHNYEYISDDDPFISEEEEERLMKKFTEYVELEKKAKKKGLLDITYNKKLQKWKHRLMLFSIIQGAIVMAAILLGFL